MSQLSLPVVTNRLLLRDFILEDYEAILGYASDPIVTEHMFYGPRDEQDNREYLAQMLASQKQMPRRTWELAVVHRQTQRVLGACDLTMAKDNEADLGYILGKPAWGRGYAAEAAGAMLTAGFEELQLDRIFAICEVNHAASQRVLEKTGLRKKCLLEREREAKNRWWDMWLYEIFRHEWLASKQP